MGDEDIDEKKAGIKVIESVNKEIKKFFEKSIEAEKEERDLSIDREKENAGNVLVKSGQSDYSALVYNKA